TVPGPPTAVTATAGDGQATISFGPPASDGGSPITHYTVMDNFGDFMVDGASSPIVVTGLASGVTYTFTVPASNAIRTAPASTPSNSVTPQATATVPTAPAAVTATAGDAQATVSFAAPASDGGSPITGYTATSFPGGISASGSGSPIVVAGLTNGTPYTFTVTATNAIGTGPASAPSNSVTPQAPATVPGPPTAVTAT